MQLERDIVERLNDGHAVMAPRPLLQQASSRPLEQRLTKGPARAIDGEIDAHVVNNDSYHSNFNPNRRCVCENSQTFDRPRASRRSSSEPPPCSSRPRADCRAAENVS